MDGLARSHLKSFSSLLIATSYFRVAGALCNFAGGKVRHLLVVQSLPQAAQASFDILVVETLPPSTHLTMFIWIITAREGSGATTIIQTQRNATFQPRRLWLHTVY